MDFLSLVHANLPFPGMCTDKLPPNNKRPCSDSSDEDTTVKKVMLNFLLMISSFLLWFYCR